MIVNDDFSPEWAGTSERYTLCTKSTGRRRGGVQTIPTQACRFPTRKLRARRGYDPPKRDPTCFSWHPRSVQQQKKGAQQLWTLPGQLGTWTCVSMQLSGVRTIYCGYQDKPELYLFDKATRATPAGPFATKEGSIFSHHARHSTSCSSEYRTLSTKSSTDLVLFIPASSLNYRAFQILMIKWYSIFHSWTAQTSLHSPPHSSLHPSWAHMSSRHLCDVWRDDWLRRQHLKHQ